MSVEMRLIFRFLGQKEFQGTYLPVMVAFLYTNVINWESLFSISMSRKRWEIIILFFKSKAKRGV